MASVEKKPLKVDREAFTSVVRKLANSPPIQRKNVKGQNPKPAKVIQPKQS